MTDPVHPAANGTAMSPDEAEAEARRIITDAYRPAPALPTSYRDTTPLPTHGSTPPVPQPGTPPMSQRATDAGRLMITAGLATVPPGLVAIGLLATSPYADPTVIGMICAAPAAIAVPILALARLLSRAAEATPDTHQHHYTGPVHQTHHTTRTTTRGVWARTTNH
ncbi:hypothetical protein [Streptomyces sp. SHP 1-2]|uniref:hypothetical protein n=1 Tax=Streptomyces sp. SHP 1-2 TaxID=2769489 RepID=UPI00223892B0|nr:hypothetical protein [Streptomyces sp. SHP 1-2]MCW5254286.1 hypothetical protein [Streptomyces sp. SHP 1-2]